MRKTIFFTLGLGILLSTIFIFGSCTSEDNSGNSSKEDLYSATESPIKVSMTGSINPDTWTPEEEATVSFARIPTTISGFKQIQSQIGDTPQGAVALQLIAFEMYNQNTKVGEECIKINNTEINLPSVMRRMPDIFGKNSLDTQYPRKHLVATYFDGATPENGFNPTKPYTIKVRSSWIHDYERSESLKGYVLYLEAYSTGYDSPWRGCEVVKQKGNEYYTVSNSPSLYVQCKEVPFDAKEDYKGLK